MALFREALIVKDVSEAPPSTFSANATNSSTTKNYLLGEHVIKIKRKK